jgi:heme/copper-type cytochrome/quinol oxidase subunit 3
MGSYKDTIDGFILTIFLGFFFIFLQGLEYYESTFNLQDGIYPSVFFLLTGLHGCHVIIGAFFFIILFLIAYSKSFFN